MNQIENKRLRIDMMALRQQIWERGGERTGTVDHSSGDYPRWIDTSTMLADPLMKAMKSDRLDACLKSGVFDMKPTQESLQIKARNQKIRRMKRSKDQDQPKEEDTLHGMITALTTEIHKLKTELECG